jgi:hypothetical protein
LPLRAARSREITSNADRLLEAAQERFHALFEDGQNVIGVPPITDRYVAGQIGLEFHVRVVSGDDDRDADYFVAQLWCCRKGGQQEVIPMKRAVVEAGAHDVVDGGVMTSTTVSLVT